MIRNARGIRRTAEMNADAFAPFELREENICEYISGPIR
ncbi:hypothetical protein ASZ90_012861 [hydrocarbon metagenome]|uniref:Uncharacterized protein n=1 Tax=hydrocarbon metagenome TaxID=938273 RepID=A0A0W8F9C4_9ZZZZ